jgi:hypothetical protein
MKDRWHNRLWGTGAALAHALQRHGLPGHRPRAYAVGLYEPRRGGRVTLLPEKATA